MDEALAAFTNNGINVDDFELIFQGEEANCQYEPAPDQGPGYNCYQ